LNVRVEETQEWDSRTAAWKKMQGPHQFLQRQPIKENEKRRKRRPLPRYTSRAAGFLPRTPRPPATPARSSSTTTNAEHLQAPLICKEGAWQPADAVGNPGAQVTGRLHRGGGRRGKGDDAVEVGAASPARSRLD
jgi:hypothetical protein